MGESARMAWITELDFEVPVIDGHIGAGIEYLFWVGCAGALEDRAKKTTKTIAERCTRSPWRSSTWPSC